MRSGRSEGKGKGGGGRSRGASQLTFKGFWLLHLLNGGEE